MKLVLKQPKDKPPFIGIQYASEHLATKTNSDLIGMKDIQLILEPLNQYNIKLRLVNKDKMIDRAYDQIEYNAPQLQTWLQRNKNEKQFNFSHVIMEFDKHVVVKIHMTKLFLIKLSAVKLLSGE